MADPGSQAAKLDAQLAYIQLMLERMEVLAQRSAQPDCPQAYRLQLQAQLQQLRQDIDRVADTLPPIPILTWKEEKEEGGPTYGN